MTPPLLDLDALTAPLPGENPAGRSVPFDVRQKMDEARKEVDPASFSAKDPLRPTEPIRADWPLIVKLAQQTLSTTSKDLLVTARLTEALTKVHGFAGVRDGLLLFHRLVDDCWDRILPLIEEEDDIEARGAAFYWLDDSDRGARFPFTLRSVDIVRTDEQKFGWQDWKKLQVEKDVKASARRSRSPVLNTPRETCETMVADLKAATQALNDLGSALARRMGNLAPGLSGIREALGDNLALAEQLLARKGPARRRRPPRSKPPRRSPWRPPPPPPGLPPRTPRRPGPRSTGRSPPPPRRSARSSPTARSRTCSNGPSNSAALRSRN